MQQHRPGLVVSLSEELGKFKWIPAQRGLPGHWRKLRTDAPDSEADPAVSMSAAAIYCSEVLTRKTCFGMENFAFG